MDGDDEGSEHDKARRVLKAKTLMSDRGKLHLFSSRVILYPEPAHRAGAQLLNLLTPGDTNVVIRAETLQSGRVGLGRPHTHSRKTEEFAKIPDRPGRGISATQRVSGRTRQDSGS